jgi:hypothetical protein
METGIDCDQPTARLEGVCGRPQHVGRKIIIEMVNNADGNGDIGRSKRSRQNCRRHRR